MYFWGMWGVVMTNEAYTETRVWNIIINMLFNTSQILH